MAEKHKPSIFVSLTHLLFAGVKRWAGLAQLASLEAQLAGKTLIRIIIISALLIFICFSTWVCLLLMAFVFLISLQFSALFAAFMITLLNIILLGIFIFCIYKMKNNLFFPATRRQLHKTSALFKKGK